MLSLIKLDGCHCSQLFLDYVSKFLKILYKEVVITIVCVVIISVVFYYLEDPVKQSCCCISHLDEHCMAAFHIKSGYLVNT